MNKKRKEIMVIHQHMSRRYKAKKKEREDKSGDRGSKRGSLVKEGGVNRVIGGGGD